MRIYSYQKHNYYLTFYGVDTTSEFEEVNDCLTELFGAPGNYRGEISKQSVKNALYAFFTRTKNVVRWWIKQTGPAADYKVWLRYDNDAVLFEMIYGEYIHIKPMLEWSPK